MSNEKTISQLIRQKLNAKKMKNRELAEEAGVACNTVDRHLMGDRIPSTETLVQYCKILGIGKKTALRAVEESRKQAKR